MNLSQMSEEGREKRRAICRAYRKKNREKINAWHRNYMKTKHYPENRLSYAARSRKYKEKLFSEFMSHYGYACTCCGEKDRRFLSVEHLHGGGNKHRRELRRPGVEAIILDIKRKGWGPGYTTLCFNCNFAKWRTGGTCPHVIEKAKAWLSEIGEIQREINESSR